MAGSGRRRHQSDLELARRCARTPPEREAWDQFYARYAGGVRQWIRRGRRLRGDDSVDDLVQQVFLLCAQGALARFRGQSSLRSYLLRIAARVRIAENRRWSSKCRDLHAAVSLDAPIARATAADAMAPATTWRETVACDDSLPLRLGLWTSDFMLPPDRRLELREIAGQVRQLIREVLDPTDRKIIGDYYWREATDRQIAAELGLSINTVTWRRHRAQARIENAWRARYSAPEPATAQLESRGHEEFAVSRLPRPGSTGRSCLRRADCGGREPSAPVRGVCIGGGGDVQAAGAGGRCRGRGGGGGGGARGRAGPAG